MQRPKQPIKRTAPLKKIIAAALSTLFLFSLSGCSFFGPKEERTEWIVDGEYQPFSSEEQTAEKLMEYIQAGDADSIYQVFSESAKETSGNLREKIEELIEFVNCNMVSWEYNIGGLFEGDVSYGQVMRNRMIELFIQTEQTRYVCSIHDVVRDDFKPDNKGFSSITIFPEKLPLLCDYGSFEGDGLGVFLSYQGETHEEGTLESLLDLATSKDSDGIYDLFSEYAKENTPDLPEQVQALIDFFDKPIRSWEFDNCVMEWVQLPGIEEKLLRRMTIFSLHTDQETYTMQIRDLLDGSEEGENLGLYSIAIRTDQFRGNNKDLGWRVPGVALYQLTIYADRESLGANGGTVRFTTSIEATVTCEEKDIVPKQIDALTWEAMLSSEHEGMNIFVATAGNEQVTCSVYVERQKGQT